MRKAKRLIELSSLVACAAFGVPAVGVVYCWSQANPENVCPSPAPRDCPPDPPYFPNARPCPDRVPDAPKFAKRVKSPPDCEQWGRRQPKTDTSNPIICLRYPRSCTAQTGYTYDPESKCFEGSPTYDSDFDHIPDPNSQLCQGPPCPPPDDEWPGGGGPGE